MMLAAFWALIPSALSFESLGEAVTVGGDTLPIVGRSIAAIFSIALATLIGWSVFNPMVTADSTVPGKAIISGQRQQSSCS